MDQRQWPAVPPALPLLFSQQSDAFLSFSPQLSFPSSSAPCPRRSATALVPSADQRVPRHTTTPITHHPPPITHSPPSTANRPPSITNRPPSITHHPPPITHHPLALPAPILSPPPSPSCLLPSPRSHLHPLPNPALKASPGIWLNPGKPKDENILPRGHHSHHPYGQPGQRRTRQGCAPAAFRPVFAGKEGRSRNGLAKTSRYRVI